MKRLYFLAFALLLCAPALASAREARLVRYPHYHQGRVAFTYLGDIWTANENGQNIQRVTVHRARDVYPRFSPDGQFIAFSSERNGNLDVYIIPAAGGNVRQLTFHSADDSVLGWSPDSRRILFSSNRGEDFMARLYTVSTEGGMETNAGPDMGVYGTYSPDGRSLAINRISQSYWRKYYRGSYQSDVTVMNLEDRTSRTLTDFNGMDAWPMWSRNGHIYFVSDREQNGAVTNIYRVPIRGGNAERVTTFTSGDVRWPAMSADGETIVFEHDFGLWRLNTSNNRATPISLDIAAETQESLTEVRDFASQSDDYALAPNSRRVAVSIHGEIFTAPVEEGDLRQLTDSPARDRNVEYSPDGRMIAFVSDRSGREELYVMPADGAGEAQQLSDLDELKFAYAWSPDSTRIAYTSSDNKLRVVNVQTRQTTEISTSRFGSISAPTWSPDNRWIAYSKPDSTRTSDVYIVASSGGEERRATFDSYSDVNPRFSPDGRKLYFVRIEGTSFSTTTPINIFSVALEREERDPNDPEVRAEREAADESQAPDGMPRRPPTAPTSPTASGTPGADGQMPATRPRTPPPPREIVIDWPGLRRRTRQITRMSFPVTTYAISNDSRTIVFASSEPTTTASVPVIYAISEDGRRLVRVTASAAPTGAGDAGAPTPQQAFGGGISNLNFSRDNRTLYFQEGRFIYSVAMPPMPATGAAAAAASAGARGDAPRRRINFTVRVRVDRPAEWLQMFDDAWRTMKYRFYDPQLHGRDWNAMRATYRPLVEYVGDRQEVLNIINEMIGELNASHTGAAPPPPQLQQREGAVSTGHLGLELEPDTAAGRYRIAHIYQDGPADRDWVRAEAGNYLISINGRQVRAGENYWELLNHRLNRRVEVMFNSTPSEQGAWRARIETIPVAAYSQLRYERWVRERRAMVDRLSGGRVGYVHIQAMNQTSLRRFEKELREYQGKEALVIDQRFNGGGNIEQELLALLVQRQYQVWQPRGTEPTTRPFAGFFGPKVVLQNWRSASNAEMFPAGFRALGLGRVIGTPTMGAVIGTGSYSLIDGSTVRTPGVGVYLADGGRTNMENYGVQPDMLVENSPEDNLAGRDRQIEAAVQHLLGELGRARPNAAARQ